MKVEGRVHKQTAGNLSYTTYFNYDKKGHYADKCLEPRQNYANTED